MGESGWIAVALSGDIEPGAIAGVIVEGGEWVVWRNHAGAAHVWEDRCPHRGMRLSFGFVRADRLACLYHGWQYDGAGQCRAIPAHPDLEPPETIRVATFPTIESGGVIWTCLAGAAPPAPPAFGDAVPVRSIYLDVALDAVAEALVDIGAPAHRAGSDRVEAKPVEGLTSVWTFAIGADLVLAAGQNVGPDRCGLHISILGAKADGAARSQVARWAERLRYALESREAA